MEMILIFLHTSHTKGINIDVEPCNQMKPVLSAYTYETGVHIRMASKKLLKPEHFNSFLDMMPNVNNLILDLDPDDDTSNEATGLLNLVANARLNHLTIKCRNFHGKYMTNDKSWSYLSSLDITNCWNIQDCNMILQSLNDLSSLRNLVINPGSILDKYLSGADEDFPFANITELEIIQVWLAFINRKIIIFLSKKTHSVICTQF
jgi:hypothetical protein